MTWKSRKTLEGKSFEQIYKDIQEKNSGNTVFKSSTIKETVFMHYEPVHMAFLESAVLILYMIFIISKQVRAFKLIKK